MNRSTLAILIGSIAASAVAIIVFYEWLKNQSNKSCNCSPTCLNGICPSGETCNNGTCEPSSCTHCANNADCTEGTACVNGCCTPVTNPKVPILTGPSIVTPECGTCIAPVLLNIEGAGPGDEIILYINNVLLGNFVCDNLGNGSFETALTNTVGGNIEVVTISAIDWTQNTQTNSISITVAPCPNCGDPCQQYTCGHNAVCPILQDGTRCECYVINSKTHQLGCKTP